MVLVWAVFAQAVSLWGAPRSREGFPAAEARRSSCVGSALPGRGRVQFAAGGVPLAVGARGGKGSVGPPPRRPRRSHPGIRICWPCVG